MTNKGKNLPAQTMEEMVAEGTQKRKQSKLYKAESAEFVNDQLSALIGKTTGELAEAATAEPVSLRDTAEVKRRTVLYMKSCEESACFPSIVGLARSMGLSRQALYDCIWRKSPAATAEWLEMCRDTFSDILAESALRNNCNGIVSIFLQKAVYGLRESVEIVAKTETPMGDIMSPEELARRIEGVVIDDDEE